MKKKCVFAALYTMTILIVGCSCGSQEDTLDGNVKKIIKTRAYTVKNHFDELTSDQPIYDMGYQAILGEMSKQLWTTQYFDKYGNTIKIEHFRLDDDGKEKTNMVSIYEYYSLEKGLISLVTTKSDLVGLLEERYIRNENGDLLEVVKLHNGEMSEKKKYSYNNSNQQIKEELYENQGLVEVIQYTYDSSEKNFGRLIKKENQNLKNDYRRETEYEFSDDGIVIKSRSKYYQDGELFSDFTTTYSDYIGEVATKEIRDGFSKPTLVSVDANGLKSEHGGGSQRMLITKELDDRGNLIKQVEEGLQKKNDNPLLMGFNNSAFEMNYTYNERGDWSQLLFKHGFTNSLIVRDIEYLD